MSVHLERFSKNPLAAFGQAADVQCLVSGVPGNYPAEFFANGANRFDTRLQTAASISRMATATTEQYREGINFYLVRARGERRALGLASLIRKQSASFYGETIEGTRLDYWLGTEVDSATHREVALSLVQASGDLALKYDTRVEHTETSPDPYSFDSTTRRIPADRNGVMAFISEDHPNPPIGLAQILDRTLVPRGSRSLVALEHPYYPLDSRMMVLGQLHYTEFAI